MDASVVSADQVAKRENHSVVKMAGTGNRLNSSRWET